VKNLHYSTQKTVLGEKKCTPRRKRLSSIRKSVLRDAKDCPRQEKVYSRREKIALFTKTCSAGPEWSSFSQICKGEIRKCAPTSIRRNTSYRFQLSRAACPRQPSPSTRPPRRRCRGRRAGRRERRNLLVGVVAAPATVRTGVDIRSPDNGSSPP